MQLDVQPFTQIIGEICRKGGHGCQAAPLIDVGERDVCKRGIDKLADARAVLFKHLDNGRIAAHFEADPTASSEREHGRTQPVGIALGGICRPAVEMIRPDLVVRHTLAPPLDGVGDGRVARDLSVARTLLVRPSSQRTRFKTAVDDLIGRRDDDAERRFRKLAACGIADSIRDGIRFSCFEEERIEAFRDVLRAVADLDDVHEHAADRLAENGCGNAAEISVQIDRFRFRGDVLRGIDDDQLIGGICRDHPRDVVRSGFFLLNAIHLFVELHRIRKACHVRRRFVIGDYVVEEGDRPAACGHVVQLDVQPFTQIIGEICRKGGHGCQAAPLIDVGERDVCKRGIDKLADARAVLFKHLDNGRIAAHFEADPTASSEREHGRTQPVGIALGGICRPAVEMIRPDLVVRHTLAPPLDGVGDGRVARDLSVARTLLVRPSSQRTRFKTAVHDVVFVRHFDGESCGKGEGFVHRLIGDRVHARFAQIERIEP